MELGWIPTVFARPLVGECVGTGWSRAMNYHNVTRLKKLQVQNRLELPPKKLAIFPVS